jgi:hypothetical protein
LSVAQQTFPFVAIAGSTSLVGLHAVMPDGCPVCGAHHAVLGSSKATHAACFRCAQCDRHRGWASAAFTGFVESIIDQFGRPTAPILVRRSSGGLR